MKIELIAGELYQVKNYKKGWAIATYDRMVPAHEEKYSTISFDFKHISKEQTRWVPDTYIFRNAGNDSNMSNAVRIQAKDLEVRPVTEECRAELKRLKDAVKESQSQLKAATKELRDFCS